MVLGKYPVAGLCYLQITPQYITRIKRLFYTQLLRPTDQYGVGRLTQLYSCGELTAEFYLESKYFDKL